MIDDQMDSKEILKYLTDAFTNKFIKTKNIITATQSAIESIVKRNDWDDEQKDLLCQACIDAASLIDPKQDRIAEEFNTHLSAQLENINSRTAPSM